MTEESRHHSASNAPDWLVGGGEMGDLIRSLDWSKTALGDFDAWPQSLRTGVSLCLDTRHPVAMWWGPQRIMIYNDGYRPMLGENKHPQFLGAPGWECWDEIWDIIGPMMDQVIETGEATWSEDLFLLMHRYGYFEETYFTFSYSPMRDEQGVPVGVLDICSETTERVIGERRLKTLREMVVDARTATEAAQRCLEILGRNPRDIPFGLVYLRDDDGQHLRLAAWSGLEPGTPASPTLVAMAGNNTNDWPLVQVATHGQPATIDDLSQRFDCLPGEPWDEPARQALILPIPRPGFSQPAGVLVLGISPRRALDDDYRGFIDLVAGNVATAVANARAYEEEKQRAERLAELDRAKTVFFTNVSHEFRTPLTLLLGPLEDTIARNERLATEDRLNLEIAHRNGLRLLRLVNALLDFSRIEAGRIQATFQPTDLATLTGNLASVFRSAVEKAGLAFEVDVPPLPAPVYVDREMWEKIVLNLLSNAFKFTRQGAITVRQRALDDHVELAVQDTGCGIPEAELNDVFKRFYRVEGTEGRTLEGTGIGLSLVQELVKLHGGTVGVTSAPGRGSTFTIVLPFGAAHLPADRVGSEETLASTGVGAEAYVEEALRWLPEEDATEMAAIAADETTSIAGPHRRILVADDNADMLDYIRRLLSARYEVVGVSDGEAAWAAVLATQPDMVLADVMMPRLDGFGLLARLRSDRRTRSLPVILLSARAGEESRVEGLEAGADDYLIKPFSARELLARVRANLELAGLRREAARLEEQLRTEEERRHNAEERARLLGEVQLLAAEAQQRAVELEASNKELQAFAYSVAHDLRAPTRQISSFSKLLEDRYQGQLDDRGKEYLQFLMGSSQKMAQLIDDLLNLSRVTRVAMKREQVNLSELAQEIAAELRQREPARNVAFAIAPRLIAAGDPQLLRVALTNLLDNAWKFTSKVPAARIELGAARQDENIVYYVKDNGAGFEMAYVNKLFGAFQRLHQANEYPGTGIGLAIVQRIVQRHGGRVWAEAEVDKGATFYFTLE